MRLVLKILAGLLKVVVGVIAIIFGAPSARDTTPAMGHSGMRDPLNVHDEIFP
jgi:hypothetical protein